jgi:hypothetical protein
VSFHVYSQGDVGQGQSARAFRGGMRTWFIRGLVIAAVAGSTANGATYYLDAIGGNDGGAGTALQPWKSLARAQAVAQPGDTVLMRNGDYGPFVADRSAFQLYSGAADVPLPVDWPWVTYQAASGHDRVDVDYIEFKFGGQLYTVGHAFEGINLVKPKGRCVFVWGVVGLRLENMAFAGVTNVDFLTAGGAYYSNVELKGTNNDVTITGCDIDGGYRGVYADGVNNNVRIFGCDIHNTGVDKIMYANGTNIVIEGCRIYGPALLPSEHPDCIQFYTAADKYGDSARATNITIRGNMMYDHPSQGVWTGGSHLVNVTFENNLMYNLGNYEWRVYNVHGGIIRNNTIVGGAGRVTGIIVYGANDNSDITVVNNIFACPYWGSTDAITYHDYNIYTVSSGNSPGDQESHSYQFPSIDAAVTALFVDAGSADYSLVSDSKAVDFGDAGSNPGTDVIGALRDSRPDAGCYEYGSLAGPPQDPPPDTEPPSTAGSGDDSSGAVSDKPAVADADAPKSNFWVDLIRRAKEERRNQSLAKPDIEMEEPKAADRRGADRLSKLESAVRSSEEYKRVLKLRRRRRR